MRWLVAGALLGLVGRADAATWSCAERTEMLTTGATLVMGRCTARGTYTRGGDSFASLAHDLCGSAHRIPTGAVASTATSADGVSGWLVAVSRDTNTIRLLTAVKPNASAQVLPPPDYVLGEMTAGTAIDGATFMTLVTCK